MKKASPRRIHALNTICINFKNLSDSSINYNYYITYIKDKFIYSLYMYICNIFDIFLYIYSNFK